MEASEFLKNWPTFDKNPCIYSCGARTVKTPMTAAHWTAPERSEELNNTWGKKGISHTVEWFLGQNWRIGCLINLSRIFAEFIAQSWQIEDLVFDRNSLCLSVLKKENLQQVYCKRLRIEIFDWQVSGEDVELYLRGLLGKHLLEK